MSLILEGPDGAGKSTMAEAIARELGWNILKMTANGSQSEEDYREKLACNRIVIDRCWISEQIYAPLFGRAQRLCDSACERLNQICRERPVQIFVVLPPLAVVDARLTRRGDEFGDVVVPNIARIYDDYVAYAQAHPFIHVIHDNDVTELIEKVANDEHRR